MSCVLVVSILTILEQTRGADPAPHDYAGGWEEEDPRPGGRLPGAI